MVGADTGVPGIGGAENAHDARVIARERTRAGLGNIEPCLPSPAKAPPSGPGWIHEIEHDGFRATRPACGSLPATEAILRTAFRSLRWRSNAGPVSLIDGEAIVCDENGLAVFELIRGHGSKTSAVLCAFDLPELDGRDLWRRPIEERKSLLAKLLHDPNLSLDAAMKKSAIVLNQLYEDDGEIVFSVARKLGCEGIVSKRLGSIYRSDRSPLWLKVKNPDAPAVRREAEQDWEPLIT